MNNVIIAEKLKQRIRQLISIQDKKLIASYYDAKKLNTEGLNSELYFL